MSRSPPTRPARSLRCRSGRLRPARATSASGSRASRLSRPADYTPRVTEIVSAEGQLEWNTPLFAQALAQFEQALPHAGTSASVAERLRYPERAVMVSIPVRLDSGEYRCFAGYRVQHSTG